MENVSLTSTHYREKCRQAEQWRVEAERQLRRVRVLEDMNAEARASIAVLIGIAPDREFDRLVEIISKNMDGGPKAIADAILRARAMVQCDLNGDRD